MALQGDLGVYLSGQPVFLQSCNITITPPKVKDILIFGEDRFLMANHILGKTDKFLAQVREGNSELDKYSDFQLLLVILKEEANSRRLVNDYFELVFPDYQIELTENSMDFKNDNKIVGRITPFNFDVLQITLIELFEPYKDNKEEYNPANDKAAEIAEKLKRGKQKLAELKNRGKKEETSLFATYSSVLAIGLGISINMFMEYTPFQLYDAFNRYFAKHQSDIYQSLSMQPFADTSKIEAPEEWYRNLYS